MELDVTETISRLRAMGTRPEREHHDCMPCSDDSWHFGLGAPSRHCAICLAFWPCDTAVLQVAADLLSRYQMEEVL